MWRFTHNDDYVVSFPLRFSFRWIYLNEIYWLGQIFVKVTSCVKSFYSLLFFTLDNLIMVIWIVKIVADPKIIFLKQPGSFLFITHWIELGTLVFCMIRIGKLDTFSIWIFLWCVNFLVLLNLSLLYELSNQFQNSLWSFN